MGPAASCKDAPTTQSGGWAVCKNEVCTRLRGPVPPTSLSTGHPPLGASGGCPLPAARSAFSAVSGVSLIGTRLLPADQEARSEVSPLASTWGQGGLCRRGCEPPEVKGRRRGGWAPVSPPSGPSPTGLPTAGPGHQRKTAGASPRGAGVSGQRGHLKGRVWSLWGVPCVCWEVLRGTLGPQNLQPATATRPLSTRALAVGHQAAGALLLGLRPSPGDLDTSKVTPAPGMQVPLPSH